MTAQTTPTPPGWGTVVGRFSSIWGDGPDIDPAPDLVHMKGTVTLTPQVSVVRLRQPDDSITLVTEPIVCELVDGQLYGPDGNVGVRIMASRAEAISPSGVQYRVSFQLKDANGWLLETQPSPFLVEVPEGETLDLADVMPLAPAPGVISVVSHEDADRAATARDRAVQAEAVAVAAETRLGEIETVASAADAASRDATTAAAAATTAAAGAHQRLDAVLTAAKGAEDKAVAAAAAASASGNAAAAASTSAGTHRDATAASAAAAAASQATASAAATSASTSASAATASAATAKTDAATATTAASNAATSSASASSSAAEAAASAAKAASVATEKAALIEALAAANGEYVYTNSIINPSMETGIFNWSAGGGASVGTIASGDAGGQRGQKFLRCTWTAGPTTGQPYIINSAVDLPAPGIGATGSLWVRSATVARAFARLWWYTDTGAQAGKAADGLTRTLKPGEWTRLDVSATPPAGTVRTRLSATFATADVVTGDVVDVDAVMLVFAPDGTATPPPLIPYLDGDQSNGYWVGTPNASASRGLGFTTSAQVAGAGMPPGGSKGHVLTKVSASDYDTQWAAPRGADLPAEEAVAAAEAARDAALKVRDDVQAVLAGLPDVQDYASVTVGVELGAVIAWPHSTADAPAGFALCDGRLLSRVTYKDLFAKIGTRYGAGDGSTTFALPDYRGRAVVGQDPSQVEFAELGKAGGSKTHTLTVDEIPAHRHAGAGAATVGGGTNYTGVVVGISGEGSLTNVITQNTGGGKAHNNLPPYATASWLMKVITTTVGLSVAAERDQAAASAAAALAAAQEVKATRDEFERVVAELPTVEDFHTVAIGVELGTVMPWPHDPGAVPAGFTLCDGRTLSRAQHKDLFALIGTRYGAGDGSTTFGMPNYKGRALVGHDANQTEFDVLGEVGGAKTHTLTVAEMPSHTHTQAAHDHFYVNGPNYKQVEVQSGKGNLNMWGGADTAATTGAATPIINSTGSGQAHNNLQPYAVTHWVMKTSMTSVAASITAEVTAAQAAAAAATSARDQLEAALAALPTAKDFLTVTTGAELGAIVAWPAGSGVVPPEFDVCDGRLLSRAQYKDLFDIIGTHYGAGDGSTTFALPDYRGRVPVGIDPAASEFNARGKTGGAKTHTLTIAEMPSHGHTATTPAPFMTYVGTGGNLGGAAGTSLQGQNIASTGGGGAHNNLQPYLTTYWLIKVRKTTVSGAIAAEVAAAAASATEAKAAAQAAAASTGKPALIEALAASHGDYVYTNSIINPSMETGIANWATGGGGSVVAQLASVAEGGRYGSKLLRATWATRPTGTIPYVFGSYLDVPTPGAGVTGSLWVRSTTITRAGTRIWWYDGTTLLSYEFGPTYDLKPGQWARLDTTAVAPAGANKVRFSLSVAAADMPAAGGSIDLDAVMLVFAPDGGPTPPPSIPYFDGDQPNGYWVGAPHASASRGLGFVLGAEGAAVAIHPAANLAAQDALVVANPPSATRPLFVFRGDRDPSRALQYTVDDHIWHSVTTQLAAYDWTDVPLVSGWAHIGWVVSPPSCRRSKSHITHVRGVVAGGTALGAVSAMPAPARPPKLRMFPAAISNTGFTVGRVDVNSNGAAAFSALASEYASFDRVLFNNDPSLVWAPVAYTNGFTDFDPGWQGVECAKDAYGRVWLRGALKPGASTSAEASLLFTLPAGMRPAKVVHMGSTGSAGGAPLRIDVNGEVTTGVAAGKVGYLAVEGMFVAADAPVTWTDLTPLGTWQPYSSANAAPQAIRFPDGLVKVQGLVKGGTVFDGTWSHVVDMPVGFRPSKRLILPTVAASKGVRMDIAAEGGLIIAAPNADLAVWASMDAMYFAEG